MKPSYKTVCLEDLPEVLEKQTIYIVGAKDHPWQVAFLCPCNCKELIQLSVLADSRPSWRFKLNEKGKITLNPSVWRKIGCKSHFFVRNGKIWWATSRWYDQYWLF